MTDILHFTSDNSGFLRTVVLKFSLFFFLVILQIYHDFYLGPKSFELKKDQIELKEKFRKSSSILGRFGFLLTLSLFLLGIAISRGLYF